MKEDRPVANIMIMINYVLYTRRRSFPWFSIDGDVSMGLYATTMIFILSGIKRKVKRMDSVRVLHLRARASIQVTNKCLKGLIRNVVSNAQAICTINLFNAYR